MDAVRELVMIRGHLQENRKDSWKDRTEEYIKLEWYVLAVRSRNRLMLHNLAQLGIPYDHETRNIPYWDSEFVEEVSRAATIRFYRFTEQMNTFLRRQAEKQEDNKPPDGRWKRISGPLPWYIEDDDYDLN